MLRSKTYLFTPLLAFRQRICNRQWGKRTRSTWPGFARRRLYFGTVSGLPETEEAIQLFQDAMAAEDEFITSVRSYGQMNDQGKIDLTKGTFEEQMSALIGGRIDATSRHAAC